MAKSGITLDGKELLDHEVDALDAFDRHRAQRENGMKIVQDETLTERGKFEMIGVLAAVIEPPTK